MFLKYLNFLNFNNHGKHKNRVQIILIKTQNIAFSIFAVEYEVPYCLRNLALHIYNNVSELNLKGRFQ